jgi:surface protein
MDMITIDNYILERLNPRHLGSVSNTRKFLPSTRQELCFYIQEHLANHNYNLNDIDVSQIRDFSWIFSNFGTLKADISEWTMTQAIDLSFMFFNTKFNGDISDWDVSGVTNMSCMFEKSNFNRDISDWDVSNVNDMSCMFLDDKKFNQNLNRWTVKPGTKMFHAFEGSRLEKTPPAWYK